MGKRLSLSQSYVYCDRLARREAANFYPAFRVLPRCQRRAMSALYAFLRVSDDLADAPGASADKKSRLADWRARFARALCGEYSHPLHPAFHDTLQTYRIPCAHVEAVLDGVEMDLFVSCYETFAELYRYCYRVASAVGLACIHIWGFENDEAQPCAESAGIALQLTNILRDLGEDASRGRIYLPQEDLERFHYTSEELTHHERNDQFKQLMAFQVARARGYYQAARPLARLLRPAGRAVFKVILGTYESLLNAIEERDYDVFSQRISLSRWRKMSLVAQAIPTRLGWV